MSDWNGKTVVVTGASAYIASFVVDRLLAAGANVRASEHTSRGVLADYEGIEWMQGDLTDPLFCAQLLQGADALIHMAAFRKNVSFHHEKREEVIERNVQMSSALTTALPVDHSMNITFVSTAMIDPERAVQISTDDIADGYVAAKIQCEQLWQNACTETAHHLLIARAVNVYGPREEIRPDGNVIPALIARADVVEDALDVWGTGNQVRAFLYVEDLAMSLETLIAERIEGTAYIAPPERYSIREIAQTICDCVNPNIQLVFDPSKPEGANAGTLPVHPALENQQWTSLKEGLKKTVAFWRKRQ